MTVRHTPVPVLEPAEDTGPESAGAGGGDDGGGGAVSLAEVHRQRGVGVGCNAEPVREDLLPRFNRV